MRWTIGPAHGRPSRAGGQPVAAEACAKQRTGFHAMSRKLSTGGTADYHRSKKRTKMIVFFKKKKKSSQVYLKINYVSVLESYIQKRTFWSTYYRTEH